MSKKTRRDNSSSASCHSNAPVVSATFLMVIFCVAATVSTSLPHQESPAANHGERIELSPSVGGSREVDGAVTGEVLVKVKGPEVRRRMMRLAQTSASDEKPPIRQIGGKDSLWFVVRSEASANLVTRLLAQGDIVHVEPNSLIKFTAEPNDKYFKDRMLWGLQNQGQCFNDRECCTPGVDIGAVQAWDVSKGSSDIVVGVADSGIYLQHEDLKHNLFSAPARFVTTIGGKRVVCEKGSHGFNAVNCSCADQDLGPTQPNAKHGTWISGIIGAEGNNSIGVVGVNWNVRILTLNVSNPRSRDDFVAVDSAINAIEFAIDIKERFGKEANVGVLNCSWETAKSDSLLEWIRRAGANGILVVAAAGNHACDTDHTPNSVYPSGYNYEPNVVSVGAINHHGDLWLSNCAPRDVMQPCGSCAGSNYGHRTVDLVAPGTWIYATSPVDTEPYKFADSGTSMAAPFVSGAAALILSVAPLNVTRLKQVLIENVVAVPSLRDKTVSGGRLDVNRAIRAAIKEYRRR